MMIEKLSPILSPQNLKDKNIYFSNVCIKIQEFFFGLSIPKNSFGGCNTMIRL
jgi:hypothetical protein